LAVENGSPVSRQMLIRALTRKIYAFDPHRLEMMIHRFRKKALQHTGEELPIVTVRGNGYLMNCDNDPSIPSSP
jgi:DNA-binding response OmpR family regulator